MQVKIFTIPIFSSDTHEEELNKFLRTNKILQVQSQFLQENGSYWSVFITYLEGGSNGEEHRQKRVKIDYREVLSEAEFARFAKYREIRKHLATEEGVPPFVIFTDEELAYLSKYENMSYARIKELKGVGEKKAEKYGRYFIEEQEIRTGD